MAGHALPARSGRPGVPPLRAGMVAVRLGAVPGPTCGRRARPCRAASALRADGGGAGMSTHLASGGPGAERASDTPPRTSAAARSAAKDEEVSALVRAAAGGDPQAWDALVSRY